MLSWLYYSSFKGYGSTSILRIVRTLDAWTSYTVRISYSMTKGFAMDGRGTYTE